MAQDVAAQEMWEFLPERVREALLRTVALHRLCRIPERLAGIRSCPRCGRHKTMDCSQIEGIADVTVGLCVSCGYIWCLECDTALLMSTSCGHWRICSTCGEEKASCGYCGVLPWDCLHIKEWLARNHPTV